jgi:hypothetical protein
MVNFELYAFENAVPRPSIKKLFDFVVYLCFLKILNFLVLN